MQMRFAALALAGVLTLGVGGVHAASDEPGNGHGQQHGGERGMHQHGSAGMHGGMHRGMMARMMGRGGEAGPTLKIEAEGKGREITFECRAEMAECLEAFEKVRSGLIARGGPE